MPTARGAHSLRNASRNAYKPDPIFSLRAPDDRGIVTGMADLLLIPFNGSVLALTVEQLAEAQQAALDLNVGAAGTARDTAGLRTELLTAEQLEARTSVPASWWEQAARESRVPHTRIGRYVRFEFAAVAEHFRCPLEPDRLGALRDWRASRA